MSRFVQSLEPRMLFTVTPTRATFIADALQIFAEAATARADLKATAAVVAADTRTIAADLKSISTASDKASNAALFRTLKTDEVKTLVKLRVDENVLVGPTSGLARRSAAQGIALLLHPTNVHLQALVAADEAALATVTAAPLAKLESDSNASAIGMDLMNIANANPSSTLLATHVQNFESDGNTAVGNFVAAATMFTTNVATLPSDLSATPTTAAIPNLVGTFNGSATSTAGNHVGRVSTLVVDITAEGANGSLTGTVTITNPGSSPMTQSLTGMVTANGTFTATTTGTGGMGGATLSGTAVSSTISGTYNSINGGDSGTFSVHKA